MSYTGDEREGKKSTSEPHPDAERNLQYYLELRKQIFIPKINYSVTIAVSDTCPTTDIIIKPVYIGFYWNEGPRNYGDICSFQQGNPEFRREITNKFNYLLQRHMVTRVNKMPSLPTPPNERRSFSDLFER